MGAKMKTAVIYLISDELMFFVVEKDLRHYNNVYVGMAPPPDVSESDYKKLSHGLLKELNDTSKVSLEEFADAIRSGAYAIECGVLL
jgi:hypothetical protein